MKFKRYFWDGVIILLLAFGFAQIKSDNAQAALGNQGTPVRCYISGSVAAGTTQFMTCVTPVAPFFVSSQRVPAGYYFLVTDIFVTPTTGTSPIIDFYLYDAYGASGRSSSIHFRSIDGAAYGEHFNMPFYVLTADHRLEVQAFGGNTTSFEIRVSGLLTNNVTYVPAIFSNP